MTGAPRREPDDRLADWVDGRMTPRERERFAAELRVSAHLRDDLAEYERTVAAVRAALQAPIHPANLADRVMARIAADAAAPEQARVAPRAVRWWNHPVTWSLASAAAVLLVALLVNSWSGGTTAVRTAMVAEGAKDVPVPDRGRSVPLDELLRLERQVEEEKPQRDALPEVTTVVPARPREGAAGTAPGAPKPLATAPTETSAKEVDSRTGTWEKEAAAALPPGAAGPSTVGPTAPTAPPNGAVSRPGDPPPSAGAQPRTKGGRGVFGEDKERSDLSEIAGGEDQDQAEALRGNLRKQAEGRESKNDQAAGAEKTDSRGSTGKSDPEQPREVLALVVLQGDALDAAPVTRRAGAEKDGEKDVGGAAKTKSGDAHLGRSGDSPTFSRGEAAGAAFDAFFADQMRSVAPSADPPKFVIGPVTVRAVGAESAVATGAAPAPATPRPTDALKEDATRTPIERTFVVEGAKEDVAFLLRRLASFARAGNLHLTNGETSLPRTTTALGGQAGDAPVPDPATAGNLAAGFVQVTPTTRVVLRFRVLRR